MPIKNAPSSGGGTSTGSSLIEVNEQAGEAYTLQLTDVGKKVRMTSADPNAVAVVANANASIPVGGVVYVTQAGDGQTSIAEDSGVSVNFVDDGSGIQNKIKEKYGTCLLHKIATDTWDISGLTTSVTTPVIPPFDAEALQPFMWFDADDSETLIESVGGVEQWMDKSGNDLHLTQNSESQKPASGTRTWNGLNVLDFDGNSSIGINTFVAQENQPNTIFIVGAWDDPDSGASEFMYSGGVSNRRNALLKDPAGLYDVFAGSELKNKQSNALTHVHEVRYNFGSSAHYLDGVLIASGSAGTEALRGFTVGADHLGGAGNGAMDGFVGEIIVFNRLLTDADRTAVYEYLDKKWYQQIDTVLQLGQSNADGAGVNSELSALLTSFYSTKQNNLFIYQKPSSRVSNSVNVANFTDDGEWWTISDGYNATTKETHQTIGNAGGSDATWTPQRHAVELSFGQQFSTNKPAQELRVFKCAVGGSTIEGDWAITNATSTGLWAYFKDYIWQPAYDDMLLLGKKPKIVGIYWHQGEGDTNNSTNANAYATRLQTFVDRCNAEFWYDKPSIVIAGLTAFYDGGHGTTVKNAQETVATNNTNVTLLPTDGTGVYSAYDTNLDGIHLSASGLQEMGQDLFSILYPA